MFNILFLCKKKKISSEELQKFSEAVYILLEKSQNFPKAFDRDSLMSKCSIKELESMLSNIEEKRTISIFYFKLLIGNLYKNIKNNKLNLPTVKGVNINEMIEKYYKIIKDYATSCKSYIKFEELIPENLMPTFINFVKDLFENLGPMDKIEYSLELERIKKAIVEKSKKKENGQREQEERQIAKNLEFRTDTVTNLFRKI